MEFLHIYDTWYVRVLSWHTRTNAKNHVLFSAFLLDVSTIPPRSGDLRSTIFVFSWSHLDQVEKQRQFLRWAGAADVARRNKTEEAHMWTTHLTLVVAAFCSRPRLQFVRGCPKCP